MLVKATAIRFIYKHLVRPILFLFSPEFIHDCFVKFGNILGRRDFTKSITQKLFSYENCCLEQDIGGIHFKNPVGLAAGFDKNGYLINILDSVGFGFAEIGTITDKPYDGNPKPRLVRLKKSKAILVNYGLKNEGADMVLKRLEDRCRDLVIGVSIGRTNSLEASEFQKGVEDWRQCFEKTMQSKVSDFYVVNISCPNLFGGEPVDTSEKLENLLRALSLPRAQKPVFLKMPINLEWDIFKELADVGLWHGISGVIIGNLNKNRKCDSIKDEIPNNIKGSISGKPCEILSNELISRTYQEYKGRLVIIGVGGIFSAQDAYEKIKRGASLVELITGLIYQGPQLIGQINAGLVELLKKDGYTHISQVIGAYYK